MANRETIQCGHHVVGFVEISSVDMWHLSGAFEPGPDFLHYEDAIIFVRALQRKAESDPDMDWTDALDTVNSYGFVLVNNDNTIRPIRDFQLDDDGFAQFKLEI